MKSPAFTLLTALATLVFLTCDLSAAEPFRFYNTSSYNFTGDRRPVFYIQGVVYTDTNKNKQFDPEEKNGIDSGLTLYRLVNGEWKTVNATPRQTSKTGAYTFVVFTRGTYCIGVKYGDKPDGAYSQHRSFKVGVVSGARRTLHIPFVTPATAAAYRMHTTRNPHRPQPPATPHRPF